MICDVCINREGITPAYAGKSQCNTISAKNKKDHPRLCGEKSDMLEKITWNLGSPPPMRGKAQVYIGAGVTERITPAYAGKSFGTVRLISKSRDHPRLCGEKYNIRSIYGTRQGSPPPMRGKDEARRGALMTFRITPAYAGKSLRLSPTASSHEDHPRLCGEKQLHKLFKLHMSGSPPPMRGKASFRISSYHSGRITPAYAGKSPLRTA